MCSAAVLAATRSRSMRTLSSRVRALQTRHSASAHLLPHASCADMFLLLSLSASLAPFRVKAEDGGNLADAGDDGHEPDLT